MASSSSSSSSVLQLYRATFNGNLQQLKRLVKQMDKEKGVSERLAKVKTYNGQGLLHVAAYKGWINICKYFIEDLNFNVDDKDNEGKTPLMSASSEGHLSTFLYLIENGADPAALDHFKTNSLHIAASKGHIEIVSLLLSKGVDVDFLSDFGTPLQMAAMCNNRDVLKLLLDHGANPNRVGNLVHTPLGFCVCGRTIQCTKLLLEAGANPNGMTHGKTPLGCAAKEGKVNIIKCLLEAGADPNITDDLGMKPIEVAALNKKHPEVKILFPVTSAIPAYSDWSVTGILKHVHSEEARQQRKLGLKDKYLKIKTKGDDALKRKEYVQADFYYGEAIVLDPSDATVFSNKSLCSANLGRGDEAWSLAKVCIMLRPDWSEAYNRAGVALSLLKKFDMAADAFCMGSKLDPEDKELQDGFRFKFNLENHEPYKESC